MGVLKPSLEGGNKREGDLTRVKHSSLDYHTLTLNKVNSSSVTTPSAYGCHPSSSRGFRRRPPQSLRDSSPNNAKAFWGRFGEKEDLPPRRWGCRQGWRRASEPQDVSELLKWLPKDRRKGSSLLLQSPTTNHPPTTNNEIKKNKIFISSD